MPLQFQGVAVHPLASPGSCCPESLEPLLEPATAALKNPHPDVGLGQAEEREMHSEPVVLPGRRARLPEQVVEPFLAVGCEPIDDLGSARAVKYLARIRAGLG